MPELRRALLQPRFSALYPELPANHWIPAGQAAARRAERLMKEQAEPRVVASRILPDEHFRFKGGRRRPNGWHPVPERLSDLR